MTTTRTYPNGVPCWIDHVSPDPEAAAAFYDALLGWRTERVTPPQAPNHYAIATLDGRDAAGFGAADADTSTGAAWNTYIAVDDAEAGARRAVEAGATLVAPPQDVGPAGTGAELRDPEDATVYLWQAGARPGAQAVNEPNAWSFSDLHAADPSAAAGFYATAFGWTTADIGGATGLQVPGYGEHLHATVDPGIYDRQAAAGAPEGFADVIGSILAVGDGEVPHWHVTLRVDDLAAAVDSATGLGAQALSSDENAWTRTTLLRDPQGAAFTLSQFTPPSGG